VSVENYRYGKAKGKRQEWRGFGRFYISLHSLVLLCSPTYALYKFTMIWMNEIASFSALGITYWVGCGSASSPTTSD